MPSQLRTVCLLVLVLSATALSAGRAEAAAQLHATPQNAFVDPGGQPVPLRGFNVVPVWSTAGSTWGAAQYERIRDKGFNAVRFVLYWDDFEPSRGSFNAANLATLDTAIARAKAAGLYVVLDMVHLWGSGGMADVPAWAKTGDSVSTVQANAGDYLRMLASRYRDEPAVAAYDPVSEFRRWPIDQNGVLRAYDELIARSARSTPRRSCSSSRATATPRSRPGSRISRCCRTGATSYGRSTTSSPAATTTATRLAARRPAPTSAAAPPGTRPAAPRSSSDTC